MPLDPETVRLVLFAQMVMDAVWWPIMIGGPLCGIIYAAAEVIRMLTMAELMRPGHGVPPLRPGDADD